MKQAFIDIQNLQTSALNVRKHGDTSGEDLIPSIRANGVIQPLLVRPTGTQAKAEGFEVLAGQRRYNAATAIAKEQDIDPIPCLIMEDGDDAAAIEASLAENIARLPMDEIDQYEAFRDLSKGGRSIDAIAATFGITERLVKQRLALADLHTPILNAYRKNEIDPSDLRKLTMATNKQQRAWWKLHSSKEDYAPTGYRLKQWLFGGEEIPLSNALFDPATYTGAIISDLFGDEQYFADSAQFWELQSKAIAERVAEYKDDGWSTVIIHDVGESWYKWDCVALSKDEGGEIHITCAGNGEITIHEGYLDEKTFKKQQKAEAGDAPAQTMRPELTKPMQNYLALHRHSAVRTTLLKDQGTALRLLVAHFIAGTHADPQKVAKDEIAQSLESNKAKAAFEKERQDIAALLDLDIKGQPTLIPRKEDWQRSINLYTVFAKLVTLDDETVLRILTFAMAEVLSADTAIVEVLGVILGVDMKDSWTPDDVFFDLFKDKEAINAAVSECAGEPAAETHLASPAKTQKTIIQNCLSGERTSGDQNWQPAYMAFPMKAYTERGGIDAIAQWNSVKELFPPAA